MHQCLSNSEAVRELIEQEYRSVSRSEDRDRTVPLSVHPLAIIKKDRYWLVEGRDSNFRLFRETDPTKRTVNWESIADTIQGLRDFCDSIEHEGRPGRDLARKIRDNVIPRHEAAEHRRVRAKFAAERLAIFRAQPPVYSMRTRGRRYNYAQSDSDSDNRADKERKSRVLNGELQQTTTASGRTVRRPQRDDLGQAPELGTERASAVQNAPVWRSDESSGVDENEDDQDSTESEISESEVSDHPRSLQLTLKYNLPIKALEAQTYNPLVSNDFLQETAQLPQLNPMTSAPPTQPSIYPISQAPFILQHSYAPQPPGLSTMTLQNQQYSPPRPQNAQFTPYIQNSMNYQPSDSTHLQQFSVPPQPLPYTSVSPIPDRPPFQQRNISGSIPVSYNSSSSQLPMNHHLPQPRVAEGSATLPDMAQPTQLIQQTLEQREDIQNKSDPKVGSVEHILNL